MTVMTRLSRLFQADMNAVLDKIEEPETLLKQAIRDMETALGQTGKQAQLTEYDCQQKVNKQQELYQALAELDCKLALCFESGKDELARALIRRKLETQQDLKFVTGQLTALEATLQRLIQQRQEQHRLLQGMKQKAEVFQAATQSHDSGFITANQCIRDEDIEAALLFEKQKWGRS